MLIKEHEIFVITGDSVTDAGRVRPVGEGLDHPYGTGYARDAAALIQSAYPERCIRVINMGVSGDTSRDLLARWDSDTLALKPDWVSVMIGINDIWRQFDSPDNPALWVLEDEYEQNLREMIRRTKPSVKGMVIVSPCFAEPLTADPMRALCDRYGAIARKVAGEEGVLFADAQAALDRLLPYIHSSRISWDRVHPNHIGAMAIAKALLASLEFDFTR